MCGQTTCTLRSAPGPTLSNEYRRTLPFTFTASYFSSRVKPTGDFIVDYIYSYTKAVKDQSKQILIFILYRTMTYFVMQRQLNK